MTATRRLFRFDRIMILFWTAFIGVGAVVGSLMFFIDPEDGILMDGVLESMQAKLPFAELLFSNLIFSGISLLIVNGITNLTAFVLILRNREWGYRLGALFGFMLMLWISIQFYVFAPVVWPIDVAFFLFGLFQLLFGFLSFVRFRQLRLPDKETVRTAVAAAGERKIAVLFFSRTGSVLRLASEEAAQLGADLIELETGERTEGNLGFLWCGRFAMHGWGMPIGSLPDLTGYSRILVFSPVWVFSLAAPVRQFLTEYRDSLPCPIELTLVHFLRGSLEFLFAEPRKILGEKLGETHSLSVQFGRVKKSRK